MLLMIPGGYESAAPGALPSAEEVAPMMAYNEALQKAGVLISLEGLHPPSMGARISFAGGKAQVRQGPFPEVKNVLGGFWIIDVKSNSAARTAGACTAATPCRAFPGSQAHHRKPMEIQGIAATMTVPMNSATM